VDEASRRFREALASQEAKKEARPREQLLARNEERVQRALESIAVEAVRLAKYGIGEQRVFPTQQPGAFENQQLSVGGHEQEERIMVEIPVRSQDGLLAGRIDYAERLPHGGLRLLDYKSALRDDLPERYERPT
jgi:hypothetical protein